MFRKMIARQTDGILRKLRLKPLSLAEKCRLQFGAAVLFSLILALLIPYFWMSKLTEKIALDAGRAVADAAFEKHFQIEADSLRGLAMLDDAGRERKPEEKVNRWLRLGAKDSLPETLSGRQRQVIQDLLADEQSDDFAWIDRRKSVPTNNYVRIVRATDACIFCHRPQGSAAAFNKGQTVGAIVVRTPARQLAKTVLMNRLWISIAGLLAAIGAMVAFYIITQRVILRPIRQLRALVNNVAEGNLDARSAIRSGDEYERLSEAFNNMLDGLQESQEKLRQANKQLDGKIGQLSDRNIQLFKANKLKSEFLANISHEFRTPLNAILGFAELLRERPADGGEKSRRYADNIVTSGRNLLNMINDLLDLAKAEAGKMELRIEKTSIPRLCESVVGFFAPLVEEKHICLTLDADPNIAVVRTDYGKVQQILYNLLSNAVKFTPPHGRVGIRAGMLDDVTVRISVSDTGPGIAVENRGKIFEKFRQLDGSLTRQGGGTGLGLAICSELANLLAGTISLESEPGKGATFSLDIPINLPAKTSPAQTDTPAV
ncbi:MAG: HAMP domain-containing histidine kinase [Phycisphaerae bacterium]|nr:HAMP domain-containing histidine kinase [Phycisphaerae bacterium]